MRVEELVGSLQTFELLLPQSKTSKNVALKIKTPKEKSRDSSSEDSGDDEKIALIVRKFQKIFKPRSENFKGRDHKKSVNAKHEGRENSQDRNVFDQKEKFSRGRKCHECGGIGHIRVDCGNLKKLKGVQDVSEYESDNEYDLQTAYNQMFQEFNNLSQLNKKSVKRLKEVETENENLIEKIRFLEKELDESKSHLNKFSSVKLDKMLHDQKSSNDRSGLGFEKFVSSKSNAASTSKIMFFKPKMKEVDTKSDCLPKDVSLDKKRKVQFKIPQKKVSESKFIPTCHYCGIIGHTRPNCFQLRVTYPWSTQNAPRKDEPGIGKQLLVLTAQVKLISEKLATISNCSDLKNFPLKTDKVQKNQVWVKKKDNLCLVVHTALSVLNSCLWYLDSACSRHMTGDKTLFKELKAGRSGNITYGDGSKSKTKCHKVSIDIGELWHQRLGHLNYHDLVKIAKKEAINDLPKINYLEKGKCGPCQLGKQTRNPHKKTSGICTSRNLELLHMDLMGPTRTASLGGKKYILVIVDDYSRYTWISLLKEKSEAFDQATVLFKRIQVEQNCSIQRIRSDHGREFENSSFEEFYKNFGIKHEFSSPITLQQNGVIERKNRVIQEMARVMIHSKNLAQHFWGEAVNTAYHIINRVFLYPTTDKTPYELWRGKKPTVKYFRVFGSKCYILRDRESLEKFEAKSDVGIFLGYSTTSRASRVYNTRTKVVMESINVVIDDESITDQTEGEQAEVNA
ncbi:uncharacterized protein LOC132162380 [Corylus avellana]|uniref:uncharacterized protein LOC132162380 n=1 Tax=Corylus avellana TaxID=13451 RepID=UPI00286B6CA4|nr:uncharacterized protein LOC132162380 [Corylus avellana]